MMKRICCVSDTHGQHHDLNIEKCDIFIFSGDAEIISDIYLNDFRQWLCSINATYKIITFGNHDEYCQKLGKEFLKEYFKKENIIHLENESIVIEGIKIFGSPYSKLFLDWAYMANDQELNDYWKHIENDTDIVITHGPAFGWLDQNFRHVHSGSESLKDRLLEIKPRYHITGHIHEERGWLDTKHTTIINASVLNDNYCLINEPIYFDYLDYL
jgi:Icc-related predicted phosphoesterase